jgi:hypothetical protein
VVCFRRWLDDAEHHSQPTVGSGKCALTPVRFAGYARRRPNSGS